MGFFKRFQHRQEPHTVGGFIGYYGLTDWWQTTFTPKERDEIAFMQATLGNERRPLTQGHITHASQSAADFLENLAETYFRGANDSPVPASEPR